MNSLQKAKKKLSDTISANNVAQKEGEKIKEEIKNETTIFNQRVVESKKILKDIDAIKIRLKNKGLEEVDMNNLISQKRAKALSFLNEIKRLEKVKTDIENKIKTLDNDFSKNKIAQKEYLDNLEKKVIESIKEDTKKRDDLIETNKILKKKNSDLEKTKELILINIKKVEEDHGPGLKLYKTLEANLLIINTKLAQSEIKNKDVLALIVENAEKNITLLTKIESTKIKLIKETNKLTKMTKKILFNNTKEKYLKGQEAYLVEQYEKAGMPYELFSQ